MEMKGPGMYRMRNGRAVEVVANTDYAREIYPWRGSAGFPKRTWAENGRYVFGEDAGETELDLVEYLGPSVVVPPFRITEPGYYRTRNGAIFRIVSIPGGTDWKWCVSGVFGLMFNDAGEFNGTDRNNDIVARYETATPVTVIAPVEHDPLIERIVLALLPITEAGAEPHHVVRHAAELARLIRARGPAPC